MIDHADEALKDKLNWRCTTTDYRRMELARRFSGNDPWVRTLAGPARDTVVRILAARPVRDAEVEAAWQAVAT